MCETAGATPDRLHRDRARATSFGAVADQYDRARPGYPEALIRDLALTGARDVLDVGCGTGKAARPLTAQGLRVLGVEPDAAMAAVAAAHGIEVEVAPFETWDDAGRTFDLVVAGQAWHWVDPDAGAAKAVRLLRPGGTIALFWNLDDVLDQDLEFLDEIYERCAPELIETRRAHRGNQRGREETMDALRTAGFVDVAERDYPWQRRYDTASWLDLLPTYSDHQLLPDDRRTTLLAGVAAAIDERGGTLTVSYATHLIAGRAPS